MEENKNSEVEIPAVGNDQNNPKADQGEILHSGGEIIPSDKTTIPEGKTASDEPPPTSKNQTQTEEEMEVHHHTHPAHGKKTWKSYFWEFLMLFLAVFCGFLAEYQLEHKIEKNREKQFMRSMINDLKNDLTNINTTVAVKKLEVQIADSLFELFNSPDYKSRLSHVYYYGRLFSATYNNFYMTDGTLMQLKNSGGFRLISQHNIVDSILAYENLYQQFKTGQDIFHLNQLQEYRAVMIKVFDIKVFNSMVSGETGEISFPPGNPPLFNDDREVINELLMRVHLAKRNITSLMKSDLSKLKIKAAILIEMIKKEYRLQ